MKTSNFLNKLKKEKKLELIEPSREVRESYLKKSESNLVSAKILLKSNMLEESVSLAYYSMYHILIALLFYVGIKSENHTASIVLLKEVFNIDNFSIKEAKKERIDKQYYTGFEIKRKDVEDTIEKAENFISEMIDFISKVNNEDIREYRKRFEKS